MIFWNEYKEFKKIAEVMFQKRDFTIEDVQMEMYKVDLNQISKDQCIENIINILSNGEHFKPL